MKSERSLIIRELISQNKKRDKIYIRIRQIIDSCVTLEQLKSCENMVRKFSDKASGDSRELRMHYGSAYSKFKFEFE